MKTTAMHRLPYRAAAALLSAYIGGLAASTLTAASEDRAPPTLDLRGLNLKIATDAPQNSPEPLAETGLEAIYVHGLPIPKPFIDKVATDAKFRVEVHATVSASMAAVIAFYRKELGKKGWTEDAGQGRTDSNQSILVFHAPEGLAALTVTKVREGTGSDLVLRKTAEAERSGLLPEKGMATVVIGNSMEEAASVTINGTAYKLGPGEGVGKPTGPKLNLAPGTYKASTIIGSKPAIEDSFTVGDGEIWGLLIGPGGNLPLQMY